MMGLGLSSTRSSVISSSIPPYISATSPHISATSPHIRCGHFDCKKKSAAQILAPLGEADDEVGR